MPNKTSSATNAPFFEKHPSRSCPLCDHASSRLLFRQSFSALSENALLCGYDVVSCAKCGFCFANHIPTQPEFDAHYRDMSKYEYQDRGGRETDCDLRRFRSVVETLAPYLTSYNIRLLDVGCATGKLLSLFKERGFNDVMGLDPSSVCAKTALQLYGINVLAGTLHEPHQALVRKPVGCIILSGVIEHIRDLRESLGHVREMLTENGLIFIEVPDAASFATWEDAPYQEFSTEHINFFSAASLRSLMHTLGFSQVHSMHEVREQEVGSMMPAVTAIFKKTPLADHPKICERDTETAAGLVRYIQKSKETEARLHQKIKEINADSTAIIVWGVGTHTLHLLATSPLAKAKICAFVDSNPRYQGKSLNGVPILSPSALKDHHEAILISSRVFQTAIEKQIREDLHLKNAIIKLYAL